MRYARRRSGSDPVTSSVYDIIVQLTRWRSVDSADDRAEDGAEDDALSPDASHLRKHTRQRLEKPFGWGQRLEATAGGVTFDRPTFRRR